jgi:divalent metal cation (Fe/Co/Zn/Cd) transporter
MNWDSFIYQFVVGGVVFLAGLLLAWRSGDLSWNRREDRVTTIMLIIMVLAYFFGQLLWQLYGLGLI